MTGIRLDIQWGAAGEYFRLAGGYNRNLEKRFYALSAIAGQKLIEALPSMPAVDEDVLNESNPAHCWFKGIWKISGNFEFGIYGEQITDAGDSAGFIYTGSIHNIAEASSVFCLELSAQFPEAGEVSPEIESQTEENQTQEEGWKRKVADALNLKPGLFGVSIDLKKLFSRKKAK